MRAYKVALIHNIIAPYRVPLFEALARHPSIDLQVYYCSRRHKIRRWDVLEPDTYSYKVLPGITIEVSSIAYHINPTILLELVANQFDCVVLGGSADFTTQLSFFVSKALKLPVILWSEAFEGATTSLAKLIDPLTRYIIKNTSAVVVPGTLSRDFHVKLGAAAAKVFIAPNIVNTEAFFAKSYAYKTRRVQLKKDLHLGEDTIVLFVGQLIQRKGIEYLIRAFAQLKRECENVKLILVGDGGLRAELNQITLREGIADIIFTGWISEEAKIMHYAIADLFILPTLCDLFPLVINEAMACALPVISTTAAGSACDMIVNGENGYIVQPRNVDALYEAMRLIVKNNELRQKMGNKSYEIVTSLFSIENAVNGFVNAIQFACDVASNKLQSNLCT